MAKKKTVKKITSKKAVNKAPDIISGAELAAIATKPIEPTYIKTLGKSIILKKLPWPAMVELRKKQSDDFDADVFLLKYAMGISKKEVEAIKDADGVLYSELIGAVNKVYGVSNEDVKKP